MAIDSKRKRAAALAASGAMVLPVPQGTIDVTSRAQGAWVYYLEPSEVDPRDGWVATETSRVWPAPQSSRVWVCKVSKGAGNG